MTDEQRSETTPEPPAAETESVAAPENTPIDTETRPVAPVADPVIDDDQDENDDAASAEFAAMLAEDDARRPSTAAEPKQGDRITGRLVQMGDVECFVDFGGRNELPIATADLSDKDGKLLFAAGDEITAYVTGKGSDAHLAMKRKLSGSDPKPVQEALESGQPLSGKVTETNKGGFVVDIGGWRAFCPISQIDDRFVEDPSVWVGRSLEFRVTEFTEGGRRLVVSRRAILVEEKERLAVDTRQNLVLGAVLKGKVVRMLPFGAFVDLGGVEGLVHISEISHARVEHPSDALSEGQDVEVQILDIQNLGQGREERISLSMKSMQGDPWQGVEEKLPLGEWVEGVVIGTTNFGAFVELMPGVNGLIHISAISTEPIHHPDEVLKVGQQISVRVTEVDVVRRRVSLSIKR